MKSLDLFDPAEACVDLVDFGLQEGPQGEAFVWKGLVSPLGSVNFAAPRIEYEQCDEKFTTIANDHGVSDQVDALQCFLDERRRDVFSAGRDDDLFLAAC